MACWSPIPARTVLFRPLRVRRSKLRLAVTWSWRRCDGVARFARGPRMPYYERNLPHWLPDGKNLFGTWRLYASLPPVIVGTLPKTHDLKHGKRVPFIDPASHGAAFQPPRL